MGVSALTDSVEPAAATLPAPATLPARRPVVVLEVRGCAQPYPAGADIGTGARSRASVARKALHAVVGLGSWLVFAALWVWQLEVNVPAEWPWAVGALVVRAGGYWAGVTAWVAWNRNIYRRRHRRTEPIAVDVSFERDSLGRVVAADPLLILHPAEIVVKVSEDDQVKHYRAVASHA